MGLRNAIPCRTESRRPSHSTGLTSEGQERDELWTLSRSARPRKAEFSTDSPWTLTREMWTLPRPFTDRQWVRELSRGL